MADSGEVVGLGFLNQWLCALIVIIPTVVSLIVISKVKRAPLMSVNDLWVPCWRGLSPVWLLICRASALIILSGFLFVGFLENRAFFIDYLCASCLALFYFALATIVSARGCWQHFKTSATRDEESYEFLSSKLEECESITSRGINNTGLLEEVMEITYQASAGPAILTVIVYWSLLFLQYGDDFRLSLLMGLMLTVNMAFLILDIVLNKLPVPWYRVADFVLCNCLFIISGWVLHACGVTWLLDTFPELSTPWAPLWYSLFALVHAPCYGAFLLIVKAKDCAFSALFPQVYEPSVEQGRDVCDANLIAKLFR